jgi:hypothetical protein
MPMSIGKARGESSGHELLTGIQHEWYVSKRILRFQGYQVSIKTKRDIYETGHPGPSQSFENIDVIKNRPKSGSE